MPLFRPLLLNYQDDENTLDIDDEFMIGGDLLAAPILKPGLTAQAGLPAGRHLVRLLDRRANSKEAA